MTSPFQKLIEKMSEKQMAISKSILGGAWGDGMLTGNVGAYDAARRVDEEFKKQMAMIAMQGSGAMPSAPAAPSVYNENDRSKMLHYRLRETMAKFPTVHTAVVGDKVFVMITTTTDAAMLEDDIHMFPSDQLVSQLRLLA